MQMDYFWKAEVLAKLGSQFPLNLKNDLITNNANGFNRIDIGGQRYMF